MKVCPSCKKEYYDLVEFCENCRVELVDKHGNKTKSDENKKELKKIYEMQLD